MTRAPESLPHRATAVASHDARVSQSTIELLMASTSYPVDLSDWRGLFIRHLVEALARRPELRLRLWSPPGEVPANVLHTANAPERRALSALMAAGGVAHQMRQRGWSALASPVRLLRMLRAAYRRNSDVGLYHVNWLQNALPLPRSSTPLLISVLGTDLQLLELPLMRMLLRRTFASRAVAICPNAEWMLPVLEEAFGDLARVRFVPFGIGPEWFGVERTVPTRGPAKWLCVTRLTRGKIGNLFAWCQPFFADGTRELHLFGPLQEAVEIPAWVHYHGPATPAGLSRDWFPHAHGLITLSQHAEGRPQVMLEAMAAGLPIIASSLPAHVDLLDGDGNEAPAGYICKDAGEVAIALNELEDLPTNLAVGARARRHVEDRIGTWDDCAARYVRIYRELLGDGAHG